MCCHCPARWGDSNAPLREQGRCAGHKKVAGRSPPLVPSPPPNRILQAGDPGRMMDNPTFLTPGLRDLQGECGLLSASPSHPVNIGPAPLGAGSLGSPQRAGPQGPTEEGGESFRIGSLGSQSPGMSPPRWCPRRRSCPPRPAQGRRPHTASGERPLPPRS